jgi:hypothetical protein
MTLVKYKATVLKVQGYMDKCQLIELVRISGNNTSIDSYDITYRPDSRRQIEHSEGCLCLQDQGMGR